jgi:adenosylcobinamide kinase / adenosylcobinamide-phosphate guanylyltransferase
MSGHELILGGQRSGKSRCAESRAAAWLETPGHSAMLLVTAAAGDDEMAARIARHQADRASRVPAMTVIEVSTELPQAIRAQAAPRRLVVIDCLTLWLTNLLMPMHGDAVSDAALGAARAALCQALIDAAGPVLLVSNEIGLGLSPMTREARRFVDELGRLHQAVATQCRSVTLMVAGMELPVKRGDV